MPLMRINSCVVFGEDALPLNTLGVYGYLLRHHARFHTWSSGGPNTYQLTPHQLKHHRRVLKDVGLLLQGRVKSRTYTTTLRSPTPKSQRDAYQELYQDICQREPHGRRAAHQMFAALAGSPDGRSVLLPRDTMSQLITKSVTPSVTGLWIVLASFPTHHNWRNVTCIADTCSVSRPTIRRGLVQLEALGLIRRVGNTEVFVNLLINKEL